MKTFTPLTRGIDEALLILLQVRFIYVNNSDLPRETLFWVCACGSASSGTGSAAVSALSKPDESLSGHVFVPLLQVHGCLFFNHFFLNLLILLILTLGGPVFQRVSGTKSSDQATFTRATL